MAREPTSESEPPRKADRLGRVLTTLSRDSSDVSVSFTLHANRRDAACRVRRLYR
jgi:hypothetical protein